MDKYVWLFPVIFIIHDMEEIIGIGIWLRRNKELIEKKFPFMLKTYKDFSTEGFSLAVAEELLLCSLISLTALLTDNELVWCLWLGGFTGCTLHFAVHLLQSAALRKYIPATATSIVFLPVSIYIIYKCLCILNVSTALLIAGMVIGTAAVAVNLRAAQKLIGWFTRKTGLPPIV